MKYCTVTSLILSLVLIWSSSWASEPVPPNITDIKFFQDERAAIQRMSSSWAYFLNHNEPRKAAALYENHISLYATFKNKIDNYNDLVTYFIRLTKKDKFKVEFNEENIRVYGATAVNSGLYTFSFREKGKLTVIPARFTFVYTLTPSGWRIVDHHSSVLPQ